MDTPITDIDRQQRAELLHKAVGDGRINLEEFSVRVGAVWAAESAVELQQSTEGVPMADVQIVGQSSAAVQPRIVNFMGDTKRSGRWLMPGVLRTINIMGDTKLDLRDAVASPEVFAGGVVEIEGWSLMGDVKIVVPEGVEVEVHGWVLMGDREVRLAAVPRIAGTPLVRVKVHALMGDVEVRSAPPGELRKELPGWVRALMGRQ
ncbi:DUF1707 SHOCT-like domain-containing protein [Longispora albida]|uniref:DUF1707 SHOCT-like domain-containing protein n=1 Tax=Longispora albida TaxID=203523 RepID=UPI00036149C0|nr:DUF1707 domain-containing protein [Longispora albida]